MNARDERIGAPLNLFEGFISSPEIKGSLPISRCVGIKQATVEIGGYETVKWKPNQRQQFPLVVSSQVLNKRLQPLAIGHTFA